MSKIKVTAEVRKLLVELDQHFQTYHAYTRQLAGRGPEALDDHMAVEVGAERQMEERLITSLAYRINKASRGESDS